MNIQLRDSKTLQEDLHKRTGKTVLPKAQLHPDMIHGMVDCDREGFDIRTEMNAGDLIGQPNPTDAANLAAFLPAADSCSAEWRVIRMKQGDSATPIPTELIFTFDAGGKLVIRTQSVADVTRLTSALPADRIMRFDATPGVGKITFVRAGSEKPMPSSPLTDTDLQMEAAKAGVKWDKRASRETMLERIEAAKNAKPAMVT